jgi:hypothetical protein
MSLMFALVLFGCADDGSACERLAAQPERFVSRSLCEAGQDAALQSDVALRADYPTVVSRCLPMAASTAVASASRERTLPQREGPSPRRALR